jgi:hypothetical protein
MTIGANLKGNLEGSANCQVNKKYFTSYTLSFKFFYLQMIWFSTLSLIVLLLWKQCAIYENDSRYKRKLWTNFVHLGLQHSVGQDLAEWQKVNDSAESHEPEWPLAEYHSATL